MLQANFGQDTMIKEARRRNLVVRFASDWSSLHDEFSACNFWWWNGLVGKSVCKCRPQSCSLSFQNPLISHSINIHSHMHTPNKHLHKFAAKLSTLVKVKKNLGQLWFRVLRLGGHLMLVGNIVFLRERQRNRCPLLASEIMGLSVSLGILGHSNVGMIIFKGWCNKEHKDSIRALSFSGGP